MKVNSCSCRVQVMQTYNASDRVDMTRNSVDGDNVCALIVPRAVLAPICSRHLLPRVVKLMLRLEKLHCCGKFDWASDRGRESADIRKRGLVADGREGALGPFVGPWIFCGLRDAEELEERRRKNSRCRCRVSRNESRSQVSCASLLKEESSRKGRWEKQLHVCEFRSLLARAACACGQKSS